jgi:hypothetical protein
MARQGRVAQGRAGQGLALKAPPRGKQRRLLVAPPGSNDREDGKLVLDTLMLQDRVEPRAGGGLGVRHVMVVGT